MYPRSLRSRGRARVQARRRRKGSLQEARTLPILLPASTCALSRACGRGSMSSKVAGAKKLLKDHPCKREHEQSLKCLATQSRDLCTKFFLDVGHSGVCFVASALPRRDVVRPRLQTGCPGG